MALISKDDTYMPLCLHENREIGEISGQYYSPEPKGHRSPESCRNEGSGMPPLTRLGTKREA